MKQETANFRGFIASCVFAMFCSARGVAGSSNGFPQQSWLSIELMKGTPDIHSHMKATEPTPTLMTCSSQCSKGAWEAFYYFKDSQRCYCGRAKATHPESDEDETIYFGELRTDVVSCVFFLLLSLNCDSIIYVYLS